MSYIDTFDHEFVGYFGGIPVYRPLESVPSLPDDDPRDFACGPENLVIGGGAGEHLGIVLKAPGDAVDYYMHAWLRYLELQYPEEHEALRPLIEAWRAVSAPVDLRQVVAFAGWQVADYAEFSARCSSQAFLRPFDRREDASLEQWLVESLGEFVLLAMPELAADALARMGDLRGRITGGIYGNILLAPPGFATAGRQEVDHHVTWGVSAWQIDRAQHPRTIRN